MVFAIHEKGLHAHIPQSIHILPEIHRIQRRVSRASSFESLLGCVQCLIFTHSILFFTSHAFETTSTMLTNLARRLAACKGIPASRVEFPLHDYQKGLPSETQCRTTVYVYPLTDNLCRRNKLLHKLLQGRIQFLSHLLILSLPLLLKCTKDFFRRTHCDLVLTLHQRLPRLLGEFRQWHTD